MKHILIFSTIPGIRAGGLVHSGRDAYALGALSREQLVQIVADPALTAIIAEREDVLTLHHPLLAGVVTPADDFPAEPDAPPATFDPAAGIAADPAIPAHPTRGAKGLVTRPGRAP